MDEVLMYQLMSGRGVLGGFSVNAIFLAGLLVALLWKPERIRSTALFRWACTFFVLSTFLPVVLNVTCNVYFNGSIGLSRRSAASLPYAGMIFTLGPVLTGVAMFCAFAALMPPGKGKSVVPRPQAPTKHPLD